MATYVDIRQPVTILVTVFSNPKNLTNVIYLTMCTKQMLCMHPSYGHRVLHPTYGYHVPLKGNYTLE